MCALAPLPLHFRLGEGVSPPMQTTEPTGQGDPEAKQKFIFHLLLLRGPTPGPAPLPRIAPGLPPTRLQTQRPDPAGMSSGADEDEEDRADGQRQQRPVARLSPHNPKPGRSAVPRPSPMKENPTALHFDFSRSQNECTQL